MISIVSFILATGLLVFIHEFGHYYIAKISGVKIEEFSIGFGKEIFAFIDSSNVRWKICAIPLGGFVKMQGMDYSSSKNENEHKNILKADAQNLELKKTQQDFSSKPWYTRFFIIAAGPLANYLFAIIILSCFYYNYGKPHIDPVIDSVIENSPAAKAGIMSGDKVIQVNGQSIDDFADLQKIIMTNLRTEISLTVERDGANIELFVIPEIKEQRKIRKAYIGIANQQKINYIEMNIFTCTFAAIEDVLNISLIILKTLGQIIIGDRSLDEISGPLSIANESAKSLSAGFLDFALFLAMLSINLGLINFLPIPMLDGGHLVVIIVELIVGRKSTKLVQDILLRIGVIIITFLIVISVSNDIKNLLF